MKFGELKSKIENYLTESYGKKSIKKDLFAFNELVLKNKNISKLYYLYDELSSKKGLSEDVVNEYINQATTIYENTINKISPSTFKELEMWVGHVKSNNEYSDIDNLFSKGVLNLESKILSKKIICENLKKSVIVENKEIINVPINSMLSIANKTIKTFISNLNESEQKELKELLSTPKSKLMEEYDNTKTIVLNKLEEQKTQNPDSETKETINKVLDKLQKESFNEINYFKLKKLNEGL